MGRSHEKLVLIGLILGAIASLGHASHDASQQISQQTIDGVKGYIQNSQNAVENIDGLIQTQFNLISETNNILDFLNQLTIQ